MRKPTNAKTENDISILLNELKQVKFFEKYNNPTDITILKKCCKFLTLEEHTEGTPVFQIDTIGDKFYIIIEGKVGVDVRLSKDDKDLKRVKILSSGESFGEIALIYKKPRLATIECLTNCQFAVLQQKHFQATIQEIETNLMLKDMSALFSMAMFNHWSQNKLRELYLNSVWLDFHKGQVVYDLGGPADSMYIINEGEFVVYSKLQFEKSDTSIVGESRNTHELKRLQHQQDANGRSKYLKVRILCSGEYFGEEEILKKQTRKFKIQCNSFEGKVLMIKKQHFLHNVLSDQQSKSYILTRMHDKADKVEKRIKEVTDSLSVYQNYLFQPSKDSHDRVPLLKLAPSKSKDKSLITTQTEIPFVNVGGKQQKSYLDLDAHTTPNNPQIILNNFSSSMTMNQQYSSNHSINQPFNFDSYSPIKLITKQQKKVPNTSSSSPPYSSMTTIDSSNYFSPQRKRTQFLQSRAPQTQSNVIASAFSSVETAKIRLVRQNSIDKILSQSREREQQQQQQPSSTAEESNYNSNNNKAYNNYLSMRSLTFPNQPSFSIQSIKEQENDDGVSKTSIHSNITLNQNAAANCPSLKTVQPTSLVDVLENNEEFERIDEIENGLESANNNNKYYQPRIPIEKVNEAYFKSLNYNSNNENDENNPSQEYLSPIGMNKITKPTKDSPSSSEHTKLRNEDLRKHKKRSSQLATLLSHSPNKSFRIMNTIDLFQQVQQSQLELSSAAAMESEGARSYGGGKYSQRDIHSSQSVSASSSKRKSGQFEMKSRRNLSGKFDSLPEGITTTTTSTFKVGISPFEGVVGESDKTETKTYDPYEQENNDTAAVTTIKKTEERRFDESQIGMRSGREIFVSPYLHKKIKNLHRVKSMREGVCSLTIELPMKPSKHYKSSRGLSSSQSRKNNQSCDVVDQKESDEFQLSKSQLGNFSITKLKLDESKQTSDDLISYYTSTRNNNYNNNSNLENQKNSSHCKGIINPSENEKQHNFNSLMKLKRNHSQQHRIARTQQTQTSIQTLTTTTTTEQQQQIPDIHLQSSPLTHSALIQSPNRMHWQNSTTNQLSQNLKEHQLHETILFSSISEQKKKILLQQMGKEKVMDYMTNQIFMHRANSTKLLPQPRSQIPNIRPRKPLILLEKCSVNTSTITIQQSQSGAAHSQHRQFSQPSSQGNSSMTSLRTFSRDNTQIHLRISKTKSHATNESAITNLNRSNSFLPFSPTMANVFGSTTSTQNK